MMVSQRSEDFLISFQSWSQGPNIHLPRNRIRFQAQIRHIRGPQQISAGLFRGPQDVSARTRQIHAPQPQKICHVRLCLILHPKYDYINFFIFQGEQIYSSCVCQKIRESILLIFLETNPLFIYEKNTIFILKTNLQNSLETISLTFFKRM